VYNYETVPDAQEQIDALPVIALPYYAELIAFMELTQGRRVPVYPATLPATHTHRWPCPFRPVQPPTDTTVESS
jgi:hypothetical protein